MTTQTLAPERNRGMVFTSSATAARNAAHMYRADRDGGRQALILEGVPVFRSGTFRDSMGYQHTWEPEHMEQMVNNFSALRDRKIVEDVPVRRDHVPLFAGSLDTVIGYHTRIYTETRANPVNGTEHTYLMADLEILDQGAIEKIESGLWRNLSSEVGPYITNDEAEYWPVYQGVAYVDFPAVEGLKQYSKNGSAYQRDGVDFSLVIEEEDDMAQKKFSAPTPVETPESKVEETEPVTNGTEAPVEEPQEPVEEPKEPVEEPKASEVEESVEEPQEPAGETQISTLDHSKISAEHGKQAPTVMLYGKPVSDFTLIQNHINALEEFRKEARDKQVSDFVNALAKDGKILASSIDQQVAFAKSLSDEQFQAFASTFEDAPALPIFSMHGAGANAIAEPKQMEELAKLKEEHGVYKETVESFRSLNWSQERIEATVAYQSMKRLEQQMSVAASAEEK